MEEWMAFEKVTREGSKSIKLQSLIPVNVTRSEGKGWGGGK